MKLIPIDKAANAKEVLYRLLEERKPSESISHRSMPSYEQHCRFVDSNPYLGWYLVHADGEVVGATYITKERELGIGIFIAHRGKGYAKAALKIVMNKHPGRFLANINPANEKSINLFSKLGFSRIQSTYELRG